eukprot:scaffold78603_cov80-Cyclotella_meneghiniana.AAC.1
MGCTQSIHANLNTIIDDETDCRDDCHPPPFPSQCNTAENYTRQRQTNWSTNIMLCHSPHRPNSPVKPPRMPQHTTAFQEEYEEIATQSIRNWIPHHQDLIHMKARQHDILNRYDLDTLHSPLLEPFLGSMYWTPATPIPQHTKTVIGRSISPSPPIVTCSSSTCTTPRKNTMQIAKVTPSSSREKFGLAKMHNDAVDTSTDWTENISRSEDEINMSLNSIHENHAMQQQNIMDVSRELLDYSVLDEDIILEQQQNLMTSPQTPRRLFLEEEEMVTPSKLLVDNSFSRYCGASKLSKHDLATTESSFEVSPTICEINLEVNRTNWPSQINDNPSPTISEINIELSQINNQNRSSTNTPTPSPPKVLPPSPNIATFYVIKSRYTHVPSSVVYAPKPRFVGQAPSGHRLSNLAFHGNASEHCGSTKTSELYPWALIRKEGRTMNDCCFVHLVDETIPRANPSDKARRNSSGLFGTIPSFRACHGFEGEWNTHTLVSRIVLGKKGRMEEPCSVILRDPTNVDAVDVTISPGIDPLLMICYLASHSKMDVEPIMGGFDAITT